MSLWTPTLMDRALVESWAEEYVNKEIYGASGRRGDIGPQRLAQAKMGRYAELAWREMTGGELDWTIWEPGQTPKAVIEAPDIQDDPSFPFVEPFVGFRLHVKTCHMKWYGTRFDSWTAAKADRIVTDPDDTDVILLSYTHPESGDTIRVGLIPAVHAKTHWRPCQTRSLAHKVAIYASDVHSVVGPL